MSYEPNADLAIEIARRVGQGAARDYAARLQEVAPPQHEELLGCFIVGLQETVQGLVLGASDNVAQVVDCAIAAFVDEAARWPVDRAA